MVSILVNIMGGERKGEGGVIYNCPVPDFGLGKIELMAGQRFVSETTSSMEIIVVIDGTLQVEGGNTVNARKGEAVAILPGENYVATTPFNVLAYRAFVPL